MENNGAKNKNPLSPTKGNVIDGKSLIIENDLKGRYRVSVTKSIFLDIIKTRSVIFNSH